MWDWSKDVDQNVPEDPMHWGEVRMHSDIEAVPGLIGLHMVVQTITKTVAKEVSEEGEGWPWNALSTPAWGGLGTGSTLLLVLLLFCCWKQCCTSGFHHHGASHNNLKLRPIFRKKEGIDMGKFMEELANKDWVKRVKEGNLVDLSTVPTAAHDAPPPRYEHVSETDIPEKI